MFKTKQKEQIMANKNNTIALTNDQMDTLAANSAAANTTPSTLVGNLIDDRFAGCSLGANAGVTVDTIQTQVDQLVADLKSKK
jgi:hypothetical protein